MSAAFKQGLVALLPELRGFARSLERDPDRADDLVQETVTRALAAMPSFREGTNLAAWTFTILRNQFYSQWRRQRRAQSTALVEPELADPHATSPQEVRLQLRDLRNAFWRLPPEQREALILVRVRGFSYDEAARICGCATGTVKARVSRARVRLQRDVGDDGDPG
jgi:RNA polymerase sigma-70 factor (ECF subfamily)